MERNDCELVRAAQAGDKAAFVDIVSRYQAMVTGITLGILKNFQSSEDAAQEVFITAWLKIAKIRDPSKLKAWLAQIARNTALTHLRKAPKSALLPLKEEAHTHSPDHTAASIEEHTLVLQELSQLPENLRLPLVLFYRENQSINNVAVSLGLSPEAVKKRLYRGRSALRDRVSKLLDPVLQRTRPGPLFTTAVASGIGAMMEPSAVAATAVTHTPATATKFSLSTTTLVVALAFPTGYGLHKTLENPSPTSPTIPSKTAPPISTSRLFYDNTDTPLVAQWKALRNRHIHSKNDYPSLFQEIESLQDSLQRETFTSLCLAEWAQASPNEALAFLRKQTSIPHTVLHRFLREWVRLDPASALAEIKVHSLWENNDSPEVLFDLAQGSPEQLVTAISLCSSFRNYPHYIRGAITKAIAHNQSGLIASTHAALDEAKKSDPHLYSSHHGYLDKILTATAFAIADQPSEDVDIWISSISPSRSLPFILHSYLKGLARTNPSLALERLTEFQPNLLKHQPRDIVQTSAHVNFHTTLSWLSQNEKNDNASKLSDLSLMSAFLHHFEERGIEFLDQLKNEDHLTFAAQHLGDRLTLNLSPEKLQELWQWLHQKDESLDKHTLVIRLIEGLASNTPDTAISLIDSIEDPAERTKLIPIAAREMVFPKFMPDPAAFNHFLASKSSDWRENIIAFSSRHPNFVKLYDLPFWIDQHSQLSPPVQVALSKRLGQQLALRNPGHALKWAITQSHPEVRRHSLRAALSGWTRVDPYEARQYLDSLPPGNDFDSTAIGYMEGLTSLDPEAARSWLEHETPSNWPPRLQVTLIFLENVGKTDLHTAREWSKEFPLPTSAIDELSHIFSKIEKVGAFAYEYYLTR